MSESKDPRKTFGEALVEVGEKYSNIVALSADSSGGSGMTPFRESSLIATWSSASWSKA